MIYWGELAVFFPVAIGVGIALKSLLNWLETPKHERR